LRIVAICCHEERSSQGHQHRKPPATLVAQPCEFAAGCYESGKKDDGSDVAVNVDCDRLELLKKMTCRCQPADD
jgi:hypothetical protein